MRRKSGTVIALWSRRAVSMSTLDQTDRPTMLRELSVAEYLLVTAFRRWLASPPGEAGPWRVVQREFVGQFGAAQAGPALASFGRVVEAVRCHRKGGGRPHQPWCPWLASEEACLLLIVGACQQGDGTLARAASGWLVGEEAVIEVMSGAVLLARTLREHGMTVLQRPARAPAAPAATRPPITLH
jgi:hypothetical protein